MVYGREIGNSGTPHLQGTICFRVRKRRTQVTAIVGQSHLTPTRHLAQSIEYCKKDGDFVEWGTPPVENEGKGKRNDLEEFKESVKEGIYDESELRELHSEVMARYPRFVKEYIKDYKGEAKVNHLGDNHETTITNLTQFCHFPGGMLSLKSLATTVIRLFESHTNKLHMCCR